MLTIGAYCFDLYFQVAPPTLVQMQIFWEKVSMKVKSLCAHLLSFVHGVLQRVAFLDNGM